MWQSKSFLWKDNSRKNILKDIIANIYEWWYSQKLGRIIYRIHNMMLLLWRIITKYVNSLKKKVKAQKKYNKLKNYLNNTFSYILLKKYYIKRPMVCLDITSIMQKKTYFWS